MRGPVAQWGFQVRILAGSNVFFSGKITCAQINKVIHSKSKVFIFRPYFLYKH